MPLKPKAKKVLELAWAEARGLHDNFVATEHLLLALIREEQESYRVEGTPGVAMQTLESLGLDLQLLETEVQKLTVRSRRSADDKS